MTDLDRDLSNRLARLAAAVPVPSGHLDPVHRSAVAARQSVRLAWLTPLVALVVVIAGFLLNGGDEPAPTGLPSSPSARPSNGVGDRWRSTVDHGDFRLSVEASKGTFRADEPIDLEASLLYFGPYASVTIGYGAFGPIEFTIPGLLEVPSRPMICDEIALERDVPLTEKLGAIGGDPLGFQLPHGLRRINATASFGVGGCPAAAGRIETSIVVAVRDNDADVPIWTNPHEPAVCAANLVGGRLAEHPMTGLGIADEEGTIRGAEWPAGYSARQTPDGAVLVGKMGEVIAKVGDDIYYSGGVVGPDGLVRPCGGVSGG